MTSIEHRIEAMRFYSRRANKAATIRCQCGWTASALGDWTLYDTDPDEPITKLWLAHRREAGAGDARPSVGSGEPTAFTRSNDRAARTPAQELVFGRKKAS